MSSLVGRNMSGNGDFLFFGYNGLSNVNGISRERFGAKNPPGPVVTAMVEGQVDQHDPLSRYTIQDGCIPEPFTPFIQIMLILQTFTSNMILFRNLLCQLQKTMAAIKSLVLGAYAKNGAIQRTATYLLMCHDSNETVLTLDCDRPVLRGTPESRSEHFKRMKVKLNEAISRSGAKMGYSYFFGVNPLATISALAERSVALLAEKYDFSINLETQNGNLDASSKPMKVSIDQELPPASFSVGKNASTIGWQFTEVFRGDIHIDPNSLNPAAFESSHTQPSLPHAMTVYLTMELYSSTGHKSVPWYEGRLTNGKALFFTKQKEAAEAKTISYHLQLISVEGAQYHFRGQKIIDSSIFLSVRKTWEATTAVSVTISAADGWNVGQGVIRNSWTRFQRQRRTFSCTTELGIGAFLALLAFLLSFAYHVASFFFRPSAPARIVRPSDPLVFSDESDPNTKVRPSRSYALKTRDGVKIQLERYDATRPGLGLDRIEGPPVLFLPGVTGVGAKYNVYALPYLRCNMAKYFTEGGHRCYALTPRWGCEESVAKRSTVYDSRLDVAAALDFINSRESQKPYIFAHCQGSVALGMGLLDGAIRSDQILGISANSVFMNQEFAYWNSLKGRTTALIKVYELLASDFFPMVGDNKLFQRVLDALLRFYPVSKRRDFCASTACHRTSFGFGLLWNHENLNTQTHNNVHNFFAGTHTTLLKHVVRMGTRGWCLNNDLQPLLIPSNLQRLQGVPILFISGTDNEVFDPESTLRDYEMLRRQFGEKLYRRFLVEGYGHLDPVVGKDAASDVYWRVLAHLEWASRHRRHGT
ncbi:MAG: hypothetical protein M1822_007341 [Bathelium mastoideum]|nr:MAG: hypothetical protein M1822_007341 [Bathelium mastoideum]